MVEEEQLPFLRELGIHFAVGLAQMADVCVMGVPHVAGSGSAWRLAVVEAV